MAFSAPTLADLNGDGKLEVILGTSMGFLYVLNADGSNADGWPLQMGEIQAQARALGARVTCVLCAVCRRVCV